MKLSQLFLFLPLLFLLSCGADDDCANGVGVRDALILPDGSEALFVLPDVDDSRCPCNASCVAAGGVTVRLQTPTDSVILIGFGDGTVPPASVEYGGFTIAFTDLRHREVCDFNQELSPEDYCFVFTVD